jgi:hypothetical protein
LGVPACTFAPELDGFFVDGGSDQIDGEVTDDGHVYGAVSLSQPRLILAESDVEYPVQAVFDRPVAAHGFGGAGG